MAEGLDGEQVDGIGESLAIKLGVVQGCSCAHRVDQNDSRLGRVDAIVGQAVAGADAT